MNLYNNVREEYIAQSQETLRSDFAQLVIKGDKISFIEKV